MSHYARVREPKETTAEVPNHPDRSIDKTKILGLALMAIIFMSGAWVFANGLSVIWDPLHIPGHITITEEENPPNHEDRWMANVTVFNWTSIDQGYTSEIIPVHITNISGSSATLNIDVIGMPSGLSLIVLDENGDPYTPVLVNSGYSVTVFLGIEAASDASIGAQSFTLNFYE